MEQVCREMSSLQKSIAVQSNIRKRPRIEAFGEAIDAGNQALLEANKTFVQTHKHRFISVGSHRLYKLTNDLHNSD